MEDKPIGYVNFDGLTGESSEVEIRVPNKMLKLIRRGQYILLKSGSTGDIRKYLARIVRGPFYVPNAVGRDSAFARASILEADTVRFHPEYHGVCTAEILGEIIDEASFSLVGTSQRPLPQAAVTPVSGDRIEKLLGLHGDMYVGQLSSYPGVKVCFRNSDKRVIPRNFGIFGTVGSGKTNTSQVLIEEASSAGWAAIVIDVEGEYVEMDEENLEAKENPTLAKKMEHFKIKPRGINKDSFSVYHCVGTESSRDDSTEFGVRFANMDPHVLIEILDMTPAQAERFLELHAELEGERRDSQKRGRERKTRGVAAAWEGGEEARIGITLEKFINRSMQKATTAKGAGKSSWEVLLRHLRKLRRYRVVDYGNDLGDYSGLMRGGAVTVIDLSGSYSIWVNNIIISDILRGLFNAKLEDRKKKLPNTLVVIEEAHAFISKEKAPKMGATLDVLRDISRRGRKRWLGLCFISQQPAHLPPEIYELCNTKVVHQITGGRNLEAVKVSAGGVNPAIWSEIPVLGAGRALIISPQFHYPLMCDVRPSSSNRKFTE